LKRIDVKIVTSVHNKYNSENFIKSWYNSHLLRGDHIIFNSHFVQNSYKNLLAASLKSTVISRGIDTNYFRSKKPLNNLKNYLFIPSRISSWKGHDLLINYYLQLPKKYKENFMLLFISSHTSKEEIKIDKMVKKNDLMNKIKFIKPTLDIKKIYETSFLAINMSIRPEGFGRTVSESLSMSCPVIAPNMGGTREQLNSFNSRLLFDINSFRSFFKALEYAINNHKEISSNARNYVVKNYSSELMCKNTLEIYKNLIN
jgi:glycosyltransferase involved in cell wall biosynthesis